jgi:UDP-N-acetylglucosamine--N-acetylmuramyl-(pentapeptide) pyrophosphoryl-undecaprenol N-acetylglucosamine transferase
MGLAYAAADMVLARAGLSTLTELSQLKKVAIIVPMPGSHQELNGRWLAHSSAAIVLRQERLTPQNLINLIRRLLFEPDLQRQLKENISKIMPGNASKKVADVILEEVLKHNANQR